MVSSSTCLCCALPDFSAATRHHLISRRTLDSQLGAQELPSLFAGTTSPPPVAFPPPAAPTAPLPQHTAVITDAATGALSVGAASDMLLLEHVSSLQSTWPWVHASGSKAARLHRPCACIASECCSC